VRIDLRRVEAIKAGNEIIGNRVRARVVKNKVAPPFRTAEFEIIFQGPKVGISREGDILDLATAMGIVRKQGAFYSYGETRLGQGREQAKEFLRQNPQLAQSLEQLIRQKAAEGLPALAFAPSAAEAEPL
jgi:recombination protein RecA